MGICGSKPPLDVNAKGQLVGDPDLATLKRLKSKVKQLQKATKKASAQVHPDGAGAVSYTHLTLPTILLV